MTGLVEWEVLRRLFFVGLLCLGVMCVYVCECVYVSVSVSVF